MSSGELGNFTTAVSDLRDPSENDQPTERRIEEFTSHLIENNNGCHM